MRCADSYGYYEFNTFPGCNQLIVSNHAFIKPEQRGKGFGQKQQLNKLNLAAELGYNCIICTVKSDNEVEKYILNKNGWIQVHTFFNTQSENLIDIFLRDI